MNKMESVFQKLIILTVIVGFICLVNFAPIKVSAQGGESVVPTVTATVTPPVVTVFTTQTVTAPAVTVTPPAVTVTVTVTVSR